MSCMSKTLLALAASFYLIPAIETAKRIGCRVITTVSVPEDPGHILASIAILLGDAGQPIYY